MLNTTLPRSGPLVADPTAQRPSLLAEALAAFEAEQAQLRQDDEILPRLVEKILGRSPDYMAELPNCREPVAVVNGLVFRGEAENAYDLAGGWLCVRTEKQGWREVRSIAHLGQIARQTRLMLVPS